MPLERDSASILDMVVAGRRILEFTQGQNQVEFSSDLKTQSAAIHQVMILGEAAKRVSKDFRAQHPEVPWSDVIRMRDKLIHHYEGVDPGEVWKVASRDIPALLAILEPLVPNPSE